MCLEHVLYLSQRQEGGVVGGRRRRSAGRDERPAERRQRLVQA